MPITDTKINGAHYFRIPRNQKKSDLLPAIEIIDSKGGRGLYPMVSNFGQLKNIPELTFFQPKTTEQKFALQQYNTAHYIPSDLVKFMITSSFEIDVQIQINAEIEYMDKYGVAFKPK